ncbi:MAG TPA: hypothetical protein VFE59_26210 [Trebonia sp.]|jgi:hypothetical protein|nr:hypothetical protein [Trebonia sp.]
MSAAERLGPTLADLDAAELTEALGASDMPARARSASRGQLAVWAQQGLDRLGADGVRDRAEQTRHLRLGAVCGTNTPEQNAELHRLWPSAARERHAADAAYGLGRAEARTAGPSAAAEAAVSTGTPAAAPTAEGPEMELEAGL